MDFTSNFVLFTEQSFTTTTEAMTAHFNEFNKLTANLNAELTFAYKTEASFNEWCMFADEHICRLNHARFVLPIDLQFILENEVDKFWRHRDDMQRAVHRAWEDVRVARQALVDLPLPHVGFEPLFADVEQSGECCGDSGVGSAECPLFECDEPEDEGNNTFEGEYMQEVPMPAINPLFTTPETLAASTHKSNTTNLVSTTGSTNHQDRRGTLLTPEQIDQLLIFWGTPELIEQHHHSRLIKDLEREDRVTSQKSEEEREVFTYEWLSGIPEEEETELEI
ncbi:hypothetical protein QM012_006388 [Aureobasidium pullulans]|uniref:Uncharacterized protein n=1 Tax=Aureobasidium pullulans TaxID=5580 RepID=A0ABR0TNF5_AURPU